MTDPDTLPATYEPSDKEEDTREDSLILNLAVYPTVREAGIAAGYSESYSKSLISQKFKSEAFLSKLRAFYKGYAGRYLPVIAKLEGEALKYVEEDISRLPKFQHTLKEIKQAAGVLAHDQQPGVTMVKIDSIQVLMQQAQDNKEDASS